MIRVGDRYYSRSKYDRSNGLLATTQYPSVTLEEEYENITPKLCQTVNDTVKYAI